MCSRVFGETKVWGCPTTTNKNPSSEKGSPSLKMLELSNSMNPQYISFVVFQALNSSAYNGISCHGLNMNFVQNKDDESESSDNVNRSEESPTSYLKHLKVLIHSRKWQRLEFHRCLGVENLMRIPEYSSNEDDEVAGCNSVDTSTPEKTATTTLQQTTEVEFLILKFRRYPANDSRCYEEHRHRNFFINLWTHWKVRKLSLSMDFTPEWTKEFCRREVSVLEELQINPECKWHRCSHAPAEEAARTEAVRTALNGDDVIKYGEKDEETSESDAIEDVDCWEFFCQELRSNHPRLKSLAIYCKTSDEDLTYLIDHAVAQAAVANPDSKTPSSILPIEKLFFSKLCNCDERSLLTMSRALASSSLKQLKSLTMSRGVKLPSRASLDAGLPLPQRPPNRRGLLEFCRSLQYAPALTRLTLGDYILDEFEMGALFESLVLASGRIEMLSLFDCAAISEEVYEKALCGGSCSDANPESSPTSCLIQNQLPNLKFLHLPREALKALVEVLKSNTSIELINHTWRTKTHEYYLDLNRGGRRILTASASASEKNGTCHQHAPLSSSPSVITPTLWPKVLERASSDLIAGSKKDRYCGGRNRKYDVVYHLLRNRILLEL